MRGARVAFVAVAAAQYAEDTEKYKEVLAEETALLEEQLKSDQFVEEVFFPERASELTTTQSGAEERTVFFDPDVYVLNPPHPQLYSISLLVDPCKGSNYDCCNHIFGAPIYGRIKRDLVDAGYRRQTEVHYNPLLIAGSDEILENVDLVDSSGTDVDKAQRRRADDEVYIAEECGGEREGYGKTKVDRPYTLGSDGKLVKVDPYTYCQGSRLGHRPYGPQPGCMDNNMTVDASASCTDIDNRTMPYCAAVAISQTAAIITCGKSASRNEHDYSNDPHCGTFLEVHRENGSPYALDENYILAEKRITEFTTAGFATMTVDLKYGQNETGTKILCDYAETEIRQGSMVFIRDSAPECCCPEGYNNDKKTGHFFCPKNTYDDSEGPFAERLTTLSRRLADNVTVDVYPYCPTLAEDVDEIHCSTNFTTAGGVNRFFSYECTPLSAQDNTTANGGRGSEFLVGDNYAGQCFYYPGCGAHPYRDGDYGGGDASTSDMAARLDACPKECFDPACQKDSYFSFIGLVGKVTCAPTEEVKCVVKSDEDRLEDDQEYYLVTFNNGRTSYPFRSGDIELHQSVSNYQLWWVQRTRHNFIIQNKKGFRVNSPTCTFDAVNQRYFPYTMVNDDGSFVDTFYGDSES